MVKITPKEDHIDKTANQLMDSGRAVFELGDGVKLYVTLRYTSKNWLFDTYLYGENKPICYSAKGMERLRDLALGKKGQVYDGVLKIEKNDRQAFALLFVSDLASSFHWTVTVWVIIIRELIKKKEFVSIIPTNWKKDDPRIWA